MSRLALYEMRCTDSECKKISLRRDPMNMKTYVRIVVNLQIMHQVK